MGNKLKNTLIGLFVVIACSITVGLILFIEPSVGDGKQTLIARFANINGLSIGTRVVFAGNPVGEVVSIRAIPNARELPINEGGDVYFYELIMHVDSSVQVFNTDTVTVQTSGLLGEKSIAIVPKAAPNGIIQEKVTENTPIYAESFDPIESAFNELSAISDKVEEGLDTVIQWMNQNGDALAIAVRSFDRAMIEFSDLAGAVNETSIVKNLEESSKLFASTVGQISNILDNFKQNGTFTSLSDTISSLKNASSNLDSASKEIAGGKGTIGKLIHSDDFYLQANAILTKVDTLMNDVNHFGLMFNLNKGWQRERLKKINYLNALDTPQNFREYFQREIDSINMSMSRISMLIDKASEERSPAPIFQNPFFKKDFADLYRNVGELSNNLKLYNEKLMQVEQQIVGDR